MVQRGAVKKKKLAKSQREKIMVREKRLETFYLLAYIKHK
jgi:hypothetical protein